MDAFELLKKDHQKVSDLFSKIESASGQEKLRLFGQLKAELDLHAHIEETVLYPALENTEEAREITLEAYEEHNVVKDLLAQLSSEATPDDEWDAKLKVLKENVEHHVEEEEGEMFDKARQALGQPRIEELGLELEAEKNGASGSKQKSPTAEPRAEAKEPENESPGVLQRLANLVGLGSEPAAVSKSGSKSSGSKTRTTAATTSKVASKTRTAAKKPSAKKAATKKTVAKVAKKAAPKKTGKKPAARKATASVKTGRAARKVAAKKATKSRSAKKATKATRAGASKRSSGARSAAAKSASRAASNQRLKTNKSKQTGKSTKSKTRSR